MIIYIQSTNALVSLIGDTDELQLIASLPCTYMSDFSTSNYPLCSPKSLAFYDVIIAVKANLWSGS
jgi:hypothetical protein